jgi:hypothetical protein
MGNRLASILGFRHCAALSMAFAVLCSSIPIASAQDISRSPFKLLFSGNRDLFDPWGQLQITVTPVDAINSQSPPSVIPSLKQKGMAQSEKQLVGAFLIANDTWKVYFQDFTKLPAPWPGMARWRLRRGTTTDGLTFSNLETVIPETTGPWTRHLAMAYNPDAGEYLMLKLKKDPRGAPPNDSDGFAYHAWFSSDGRRWTKFAGTRRDGGLFYEGDAMTVLWSPVLKRFVLVSKSLQPWDKRIKDHGRNRRRVLVLRTSPDGREWTPGGDLTNIFGLNPPRPSDSHPAEWYTVPDAQDPPDLEFYSGNAFWYHDRAYMMVLNYAASRVFPEAHGEELDNEWWTSYDGLHWERPARGVNALAPFRMAHKRYDMGPMVLNGQLIWMHHGRHFGLPEDRISGVSARVNGEFSTRLFKMPDGDLLLNTAVPSLGRPWLRHTPQPYVMVEVLNAKGGVIPGFEKTNCVIWNPSDGQDRDIQVDQADLRLLWNGVSARKLSGQRIRLRFYFAGSTIYAVTSDPRSRNMISRMRSESHFKGMGQALNASLQGHSSVSGRMGYSCQPIALVQPSS